MNAIDMFLKEELNTIRSDFCKKTGLPNSTLSSWVVRGKNIKTLPIYFFEILSKESQLPIEEVFRKMKNYDNNK